MYVLKTWMSALKLIGLVKNLNFYIKIDFDKMSKGLKVYLWNKYGVIKTKPDHSYRCKIPSDRVPIGSGTLAKDFGGTTIWTLWSMVTDEI